MKTETEIKLAQVLGMLDAVWQAHHELVHSVNPETHKEITWRLCSSFSCIDFKNALKDIKVDL